MGMLSLVKMLVSVALIFGGDSLNNVVDGLSVDYYALNCPLADAIVRRTVNTALTNDPSLAAGLLRMHFHDCFVQGCDGSVLLDSTRINKAEKDAVPNQSLRGFEVIDQAKQYLEEQCRGVVSCADIVAMAARDAVYLTGGPYYDVPKGRRDGMISRAQDTFSLPSPLLDTTGLILAFGQHGFTAQEMVALSGKKSMARVAFQKTGYFNIMAERIKTGATAVRSPFLCFETRDHYPDPLRGSSDPHLFLEHYNPCWGHTLGVASCNAFKNRLSNFSSTSNVDPSLHPILAIMLSRICRYGDNYVAPFDWTRITFDNAYFKALQMSGGLLTSDQTLYTDERTRSYVNTYAASQDAFFLDFSSAVVKMGALYVKEGWYGQVRLNCHKVN